MRLKTVLASLKNGFRTDSKYAEKIFERELAECVNRTVHFSVILMVIFFVYGFTSYSFLHKFDPNLRLWDNVWPRLLFNSIPTLVLTFLVEGLPLSNRNKLFLWITGFSSIFHAGAWIHVWPLALRGNPEVLTYVNAANTYLFAFTYVMVSPPNRYLLPFTAILGTIFILPLFAVSHLAGDPVIFNLLVNDSMSTIASGMIISTIIQGIRTRLNAIEIEREDEAKKFLGPIVSQAIFEQNKKAIQEKTIKGFTVSLDIRNSTQLQNKYGIRWAEFQREYSKFLHTSVARHKGYIQKTVGDRFVISFGVLDDPADLSDIPGLESEIARSDERRLRHVSENAFACMDELLGEISVIGRRHIPTETICAGAGIDKGSLLCGVFGDESSGLEFDINGVPVNCSDRLEKFGKSYYTETRLDGSVLVISPFASDYLEDLAGYKKVHLHSPVQMDKTHQIQDFSKIRWVLVKEYVADRVNARMAA